MVEGRERLRPHLFPERNSKVVLAEQARPDHFLRNLAASESRALSAHEIGELLHRQMPGEPGTHTRLVNQESLFATKRARIKLGQHSLKPSH